MAGAAASQFGVPRRGAADRPPTPTVGRDAARGGLGLYLVARICGAHGWFTEHGRKVSWARVDHTRAEAPPEVWQAVPSPATDTPIAAAIADPSAACQGAPEWVGCGGAEL